MAGASQAPAWKPSYSSSRSGQRTAGTSSGSSADVSWFAPIPGNMSRKRIGREASALGFKLNGCELLHWRHLGRRPRTAEVEDRLRHGTYGCLERSSE